MAAASLTAATHHHALRKAKFLSWLCGKRNEERHEIPEVCSWRGFVVLRRHVLQGISDAEKAIVADAEKGRAAEASEREARAKRNAAK